MSTARKLLLALFTIIGISCVLTFGGLNQKAFAEEALLSTANDTIVEVEEGFVLSDNVSVRLSGKAMKFSAKVTKEFHEEISDGAEEVTYFATMNVVGSNNVKALKYGVQPDFTEVNEYNLCSYLNFEGASQNILDIALKTEFESGAFVKVVKGGQTTFYKAKNSNEVDREMRVVALDAYLNFEEGKGYEKQDILDFGYFSLGETKSVIGERGVENVYFNSEETSLTPYYIENGKIVKAELDQRTNWHFFNFNEEKENYLVFVFDQNNVATETTIEIKHATEGLTFSLINGDTEYSVTSYTGSDTEVCIPTYYSDKLVTSIGSSAFCYCDSLTRVVIGDSVASIGYRAFYYCDSLETIEIPSSVTSIGYDTFYDCSNLKTVNYLGAIDQWVQIKFDFSSNPLCNGADLYINGEKVVNTKLTNATKINAYAFDSCSSLESIELPSSVTNIEEYAFCDCSNLKAVIFDENSKLETIGSSAFLYCSSLASIEIPVGVTSIGYVAFYDCSNLKTIYCEAGGQPEGWDSKWNYNCPAEVYWYSEEEPEINEDHTAYVKNSWHYVDGQIFAWEFDHEMTVSVIEETCEEDGYTLHSCSCGYSYKSDYVDARHQIVYVDSKEPTCEVGWEAYEYCSICDYTTYKEIPAEHMYNEENTCTKCAHYADDGVEFEKVNAHYIVKKYTGNAKEVIIPSEYQELPVKRIETNAFSGCSQIEKIYVPKSVETIGAGAFANCINLITAEIYGTFDGNGCSVNSISQCDGYGIFAGCYNLQMLAIADLQILATIRGWADYHPIGLLFDSSYSENVVVNAMYHLDYNYAENVSKYYYFPKSLKTIKLVGSEYSHVYPFRGLESVEEVIVEEGIKHIRLNLFLGCEVNEITIPNTITTIGSSAFSNCKSQINLPKLENLTKIDRYAFNKCEALEYIVITDSVSEIGESAFSGCVNLKVICCEAESQPEGWDSDWKGDCSAEVIFGYVEATEGLEFTLINNDTEYEVGRYSGTATDVVIPNYYNGKPVTSIRKSSFENRSAVLSVKIPNTVISIGSYAFEGCTSLKSVIFEEGSQLDWIGTYAFYDCNALSDISLPEGLTRIESFVFCYNTSLKTLVIPKSVTYISYSAINSNQTTVYCRAASRPSDWNEDWCWYCYKLVWGYNG